MYVNVTRFGQRTYSQMYLFNTVVISFSDHILEAGYTHSMIAVR